jgi:predicted alpha/beta hydrolase family esterase
MTSSVLFIQGGGEGAHAEDALLADSLKQALGADYELRFPQMPNESEPDPETWKPKITSELEQISGPVILVAHSLGGSILLNDLSEAKLNQAIAGLFLLAAPAWDGDQWSFDDLKLPGDIAEKLAVIPRIFFYHCQDDEVVPFSHLAIHRAQFPQAVTREFAKGGHAFSNDLTRVATDIQGKNAA